MAETLRIEIPIEVVDDTDPELSNISRHFERMEKAADNAKGAAKKANSTVTQFDKQAQKTEKSLKSWAKEKYEIMLEAKDKITPILSTLGNGLRSFAGKTWSVTMRAIDLITSPVRGIINLLKNPIFQVGAVLGVSIGLKDTIETYKDFEAAMSQVQAISGATGSELTKLKNKAKEMGSTTKYTAQQSGEAFNYMAMAGWKTEDMLNGIEGILNLAAASGEELATTSDIVTDALTAFNLKAADAGHFSDVLAVAASNANTTVSGMGETFKYAGSMAGSLGYSIEDVALMTGLMANAGIKGTMSGTALNTIFTRLSTNTSNARDTIKALGVEFFDANGNARDLSDVMDELRVATEKMNDVEKSELANKVAGMEAQKGLLAILNASEEDYRKLSKAINNADGAASNMADTMMDNLQGSITLLQSAVDGVKISFGERLSPYVRSLADWLTDQMPAIERELDKLMDWVDTKVDRMQRKFDEISDTKEWQDADFFGKVKIAWDEFIDEPLKDWWNSKGKAKIIEIADDAGSLLGTALKGSILTLLGIDYSSTIDEGASIGMSFAKGFSEGFDFDLIQSKLTEGLGNIFKNAMKLLPGGESADISSLLSAGLLMKILSPAVSMGKGVASIGKGLFGTNAETGTSLMGSFLGSAATGSGLLGKSAMLAINTGAGNLAGGASLSAGALSAIGLAEGAGAIAGAAGLVHGGMDLYTGFTSDDKAKAAAYKKAGAIEVGGTLAGAGAGAAAGAAIGALFGGVGAVPGALIGTGIGAIGSWIAGNKVKEEYQDNVEQMKKEAEKAQKVFKATGYSIDEITLKNNALTQAMNDSEVSAEQFAVMFQEEVAKISKNAFGDIKLSLEEVKKLADNITFGEMKENFETFQSAASVTQKTLSSLQDSVIKLKKENWKASFGVKLSETEIDNYKSSIDNFVKNAQDYIKDNHYEATVALKLLMGDAADTSGTDSMYTKMQEQAEEIALRLSETFELSIKDSVITLDEAAEIENLQNQIMEITNRLSESQADAKFDTLKIKYSGAALDVDSFHALQAELKANVSEMSEQYENALTITLTNLNIQLADGAISQEEYDNAVKEATNGYNAQINELNARVTSFSLETIADAYSNALEGVLPELEGTTAEKLSQALKNAIALHPDISTWEKEDVSAWFGLDKLDLDSTEQAAIVQELIQTAFAVPKGTKEEIISNFKSQIPTAAELYAGIDWSSMTQENLRNMLEDIIPDFGPNGWVEYTGQSYDASAMVADLVDFDNVKLIVSKKIEESLQNSTDLSAISTWLDSYKLSVSELMKQKLSGNALLSKVGFDNIATEEYNAALYGTGNQIGTSFTKGASESLLNSSSVIRSSIITSIQTATSSPFSISPVVNVTPRYNITKFSLDQDKITTLGKTPLKNAAGGFVSGGPQLSWLAEEGYGEFIIPTNPSRRSSALALYEQAGNALGVSAYAAGGYAKGIFDSNSALKSDSLNYISNSDLNAARAYNETTGQEYIPQAVAGTEGNTGNNIKISIQMNPEFNISGAQGQSEESIVELLRMHLGELTDEIAGNIADKLDDVFSNMPMQEV